MRQITPTAKPLKSRKPLLKRLVEEENALAAAASGEVVPIHDDSSIDNSQCKGKSSAASLSSPSQPEMVSSATAVDKEAFLTFHNAFIKVTELPSFEYETSPRWKSVSEKLNLKKKTTVHKPVKFKLRKKPPVQLNPTSPGLPPANTSQGSSVKDQRGSIMSLVSARLNAIRKQKNTAISDESTPVFICSGEESEPLPPGTF